MHELDYSTELKFAISYACPPFRFIPRKMINNKTYRKIWDKLSPNLSLARSKLMVDAITSACKDIEE